MPFASEWSQGKRFFATGLANGIQTRFSVQIVQTQGFSNFQYKRGKELNMRTFCIAAIVAGLVATGATAQTSAGGSASGNASVTPGQASAGANASQSAQTPAASTGVNGAANAQASHSKENKKDDKSSAAAGSNSAAGVNGASGALSSGTTLQAELTKSIDAKKAKQGDEVTAKLTQDVKSSRPCGVAQRNKTCGARNRSASQE